MSEVHINRIVIYFLSNCSLIPVLSIFSAPAPDDGQNSPLGRSGRILISFTFVILYLLLILKICSTVISTITLFSWTIDLFHNGGLLMYSFKYMIISLSDLV